MQRQYYQSAPGAPHFEDGAVNYLDLPAIEIGLDLLDRIGLDVIHARVAALGDWLIDAIGDLEHSDGSPAATFYGRRSWEQRGATIAFNFLHLDGRVIDERYVDRIASNHNVSLRTGCFCNPGAGEIAFTISRETLVGGEFGDGMALDELGPSNRPAIRRRHPRITRARHQPRRPEPLQRLRRRVSRPRGGPGGSPTASRLLTTCAASTAPTAAKHRMIARADSMRTDLATALSGAG